MYNIKLTSYFWLYLFYCDISIELNLQQKGVLGVKKVKNHCFKLCSKTK